MLVRADWDSHRKTIHESQLGSGQCNLKFRLAIAVHPPDLAAQPFPNNTQTCLTDHLEIWAYDLYEMRIIIVTYQSSLYVTFKLDTAILWSSWIDCNYTVAHGG